MTAKKMTELEIHETTCKIIKELNLNSVFLSKIMDIHPTNIRAKKQRKNYHKFTEGNLKKLLSFLIKELETVKKINKEL